jgi:ABC-2 type transport system ATP-binding protein
MPAMSASPRIAPKRRPGRRLAAAPVDGQVGGVDAPSDTIRICTRGLTKRYGDLVAVDHLDLDVHAGQIYGLLGQNGAGKTTTILMLLGLTEPTEGQARVVGLDPSHGPLEVKRRVGYMPDSVGFYGDLTGRQNLRYTARLNRIERSEAETTIVEVLEQVGLTDRADDPALDLDEPTTAIDPLGVVEVLELLRRLVDERGMAILLSSHLLNQVQSVCDQIGIFASGRLIGHGTMAELAARFGDGRAQLEVGLELADEAAREGAATLLCGIDGVVAVQRGSRPSDPWLVTVRDPGEASTVRASILRVVAEAGLPLVSIGTVVPNLEGIYRRAIARPGTERP